MSENAPASSPPRTVVFDLGKVLLDFDYRLAVGRLMPRVKVSLAEIQRLLTESPLLSDYETGRLSTREFYERVREATGFDGDLALFEAIFGDIFSEIEPMTALLPGLKKAGVKLCAFSNTNDMAIRHIRRHYPFYGLFDHTVLSYEHGVMKPDARLYEIVEQTTGCAGPELLYFDDREENVTAALARGWRAVHHTDPARSVAAVRSAGLPTPQPPK
jgi:HAD superfamily hydrolase (TIGR01509 family)